MGVLHVVNDKNKNTRLTLFSQNQEQSKELRQNKRQVLSVSY